jgi:itaconate CoA-transferase
MSDAATIYREKAKSADEAVADIPDGALFAHAFGLNEPLATFWALETRLRLGNLQKLRVFGGVVSPAAMESILALDLADRVEPISMFVGAAERGMVRSGLNSYLPNHLHQLPRLIREHLAIDVMALTVSPMDRAGYFNFGLANGFCAAAVRSAKQLIVEVNQGMPRIHGDGIVHVSEVSAVVERPEPLVDAPEVPLDPLDDEIARRIAAIVPDGATLQVGIGGLPDAVCRHLADRRDLGIHTELFGQGLIDLVRSGAASGRRKNFHPGRHVFTFASGNREAREFLNDNPAMESRSVDYTNRPSIIAQNDGMVSINSILQVDLSGQANAESLGGHQFSGSGGQLDFVRGAYDSSGGKSILAVQSTAQRGTVSRIVPRLPEGTVVTTPRNDIHYLATEFGITNLKGKTTRERALAIIELAHPQFREELLRAAEEMYIV